MKLMIVDDNESIRLMMCQLFDDDADEIFQCSDGTQAVEQYKNCNPDYVLMDIEMKNMDGLKATEMIKKENAGAKIIIVTSHDTSKFSNAALKVGAMGLVAKENLFIVKDFFNKKSV